MGLEAGGKHRRVGFGVQDVCLWVRLSDQVDENTEWKDENRRGRFPPHWPIYLDGDPAMQWRDAVEAIDVIRGLGAGVIPLTRQPKPAKMRDH
jgi:hypothetical protein